MGKQKTKTNYRRRLLRLPDLDHCKRAVLNSLDLPASRVSTSTPSTKFLTAMGLFIGQPPTFFDVLTDLAMAADAATRQC